MDKAKPFKQRPNIGSRVTREGHARFWERPEVKFLRATRQTEKDLHRRRISPEPPIAEMFADGLAQPVRATNGPSALVCDDLYYGFAFLVARPWSEAGPARHGGLWRWRVAWVIDLGFDVMETASFFRAETGDNRLEMVRREFG